MEFASNHPFPFSFSASFPGLQATSAQGVEQESVMVFPVPAGMTFWPVFIVAVLTADLSTAGSVTFDVQVPGGSALAGSPSATVAAGATSGAAAVSQNSCKALTGTRICVVAKPSANWTVNLAADAAVTVCGYLTADR